MTDLSFHGFISWLNVWHTETYGIVTINVMSSCSLWGSTVLHFPSYIIPIDSPAHFIIMSKNLSTEKLQREPLAFF